MKLELTVRATDKHRQIFSCSYAEDFNDRVNNTCVANVHEVFNGLVEKAVQAMSLQWAFDPTVAEACLKLLNRIKEKGGPGYLKKYTEMPIEELHTLLTRLDECTEVCHPNIDPEMWLNLSKQMRRTFIKD